MRQISLRINKFVYTTALVMYIGQGHCWKLEFPGKKNARRTDGRTDPIIESRVHDYKIAETETDITFMISRLRHPGFNNLLRKLSYVVLISLEKHLTRFCSEFSLFRISFVQNFLC